MNKDVVAANMEGERGTLCSKRKDVKGESPVARREPSGGRTGGEPGTHPGLVIRQNLLAFMD